MVQEVKREMFEEIADAVFVVIPFQASLTLSAVLFYWYYKDRNKRKLTFAIGTAFGTVANFYLAQSRLGVAPFFKPVEWLFVPMAFVVPIAAFSSLLRLKDFDKPFKLFLVGTTGIAVLFFLQAPLDSLRLGLMGFFMIISIPTLFYLVARDKESSDLIFLVATLCFMAQGLTTDAGASIDIPILLNLFGELLTAFMFIVPSRKEGGLSSFLKLEKQLDRTQKDLKITQEKLLRAERFAAIGELAGMIGHDLRNPLQGIAGATYYLKSRSISEDDGKGRDMLAIIESCIEDSNKIINDLLEYSREITVEPEETDPQLLVHEALLQLSCPASVEIIDETQQVPRLRTDREKMKRVFVNLIKNALDAMPNGGKLTISSVVKGNEVVFSFRDTGVGMSLEVMGKLWSPLFTTKARGMGFGLPICRRIVEAHGGRITVKSQEGKGSEFRVIFPIKPKINAVENGLTVFVDNEEPLRRQKVAS
jgi:signal transduction histidine kinase